MHGHRIQALLAGLLVFQKTELGDRQQSPRIRSPMKKKLSIALAVLFVLSGSVYGLYRYYYPLGIEHRCDILLWFALQEYAQKHDGAFPTGEATPEASISLIQSLHPSDEYAYMLHRRDVPIDVVQQILKRGELLGPDTCGWNYVEGLRLDSNPRLALFWDKEGLGHNGERLSGGGHVVTFVSSIREHITAADWDGFLEEQRKLLDRSRDERSERRPFQ